MTDDDTIPPRSAPRAPAPVVPGTSIAGRTLMLLVAIMSFWSCVTLGSVVLIQKSALGWSAEVGREMTVEIRPIAGEIMDANLRTAVALVEASPGIGRAYALSDAQSRDLLKPWLGADIDLEALGIPRLVIVEIADPHELDLPMLEKTIATIPGASLDTHAAWRQQLNVMAGTMVISGLLVLALIIVATIVTVIFATRGTMASSREIVDVLHFIGASNAYIAGEFQRRFLTLGLTGGLIGGISALVFFLATGAVVSTVLPPQSSTQIAVLFGGFALGLDGVVGILAVVPIVAGLTALTSRLTVRRFLSQIS